MKIYETFTTENKCYITGAKINPKGCMIHSIGCPQPSAKVMADKQNNHNIMECVHAFIDNVGNVYQTLPWSHRGWHCAKGSKGSANNTHIGIEMTEPSTIKYTGGANFVDNDPVKTKEFVFGTYKTAVELFADLSIKYKWDPLEDGVIISHSEGCKRGIASNHADVEHLWNRFGLSMEQFRKDIKSKMEESNAMAEYIKILVDGEEKTIERVLISDSNFLNARAIGEALGYNVSYDEAKKMPVFIKK